MFFLQYYIKTLVFEDTDWILELFTLSQLCYLGLTVLINMTLVTNDSKIICNVLCFSWWITAVIGLSIWTFSGQGFSWSTLCSPAINPNGALLDKEQEYSSQWILAAGSGTAACVRACGFGRSRDIWRNAGITQSPLACPAQPHIVSGFLTTTIKWSGNAKCGLFDGTFTDFYTGWSHMTPQPSINQKQSAFFSHKG